MNESYWNSVTRKRIARRRLLKSGAALSMGAAALALVGCGDDDDDAGGGGGGNTTAVPTEAGQPKPGGTLEFGLTSDLTSLEPHVFILSQRDSINQVWDTLTKYDTDGKPQPFLAESWDINADSTEFVIHLRKGVKFHSGREMKAEDIVFNVSRVQAEGTAFGQLRAMARLYDPAEAVDDYTVRITSSIPRPATFDFFENFLIGDKDTLDKDPTKAVGTGAFSFVEWRSGDQFTLKKNPDYWMAGRPYIDGQVYHVALDGQTMVTQFESNALDIAIRPAIRDFVRWRDGGNYQTFVHPTAGAYYCVGWNSAGSGGTPPEFRDKRVRQALNWAINRKYFTDTILLKTVGEPYSLPWPKSSIAYEADKVNYYSYDPDKAKSMLSEAGATNMSTFKFIKTPENPELDDLAQAYQADLKSLGLNTEVDVRETAAFVEAVNADPPTYNGMWIANASYANLTPITMINLTNVLYGTVLKGELDGHQWGDNNTGYYSPEWTALIDEINKEGDAEKLKQLYSEMNDIFIEDSWIGFLAPKPPRIGAQARVKGIKNFAGTDGFYYTDAWIDA